ncbi:MAG: serine/threonine protein kinase [Myxococcales bacterium]|nr:serine/threonine protein kinase [Myxococcales bacterium]
MSDSTSPRTLNDRWELTEKIGSGAMGEVWRGRHTVLGHEVAVKLMKREASRDQQLVTRFVREARIAAQLRHRNIARVEDFGTTPEGRPFLVMELLRGASLESLLESRSKLDLATVSVVARHVGAACDVAHAAGIVHRDLKPANCFLVHDDDASPLVKVLDFGVAKVADGLLTTQHGLEPGAGFALIGTPIYMSPEQASGDANLDGRSDLWSLGVMLYELVTGALPYSAESLPQLLCQIVSAEVRAPSTHDPELPMALDQWATRAFAKSREARFQDGKSLAEALVTALGAPRTSLAPTVPMPVSQIAGVAPTHEMREVPSPLLASLDATVAMPNEALLSAQGAYGGSLAGPMPFAQHSLAPQVVPVSVPRALAAQPALMAAGAFAETHPRVPMARSKLGGVLMLVAGGLVGALVVLLLRDPAPNTVAAAAPPRATVTAPPREAPVAAPAAVAEMPVQPTVAAPAVQPSRAIVTSPEPTARPGPAPRAPRGAAAPRALAGSGEPRALTAPPAVHAPAPHNTAYNPDEP